MNIESPQISWRNHHFRYGTAEGGLWGERCPSGHLVFPPRDICPKCSMEAKEAYKLSGRGEVYSFTRMVDSIPEGFEDQAPYYVALIQLEEGPMLTVQLTDIDPNEPVYIGQRVEMVTRVLRKNGDSGIISYGFKFRPLLSPR